MERRAEFVDFLKARRARVQPEDVGLPTPGGRRRTPGLRREDVAALAGVSVDYYVRLEQGRKTQPSRSVLDALAKALRLDDDERGHLLTLANQAAPPVRQRSERVRPGVLRLLDVLDTTPGFVLGRRMDVLAWNPMAAILLGDFGKLPTPRRNMLYLLFLDPRSKILYRDWQTVALESVAHLRATSARHQDDPMIGELVRELNAKSPDFRRWWARHDVREKGHGRKNFHHPDVGALSLDYETLRLHNDDDQVLVTYTAEPGGRSQAALDLLAVLCKAGGPITDRSADDASADGGDRRTAGAADQLASWGTVTQQPALRPRRDSN